MDNLNSPIKTILNQSNSPCIKNDSNYPVDYIASFAGQHNQLMSITSADIVATDLLQSCDHLEKNYSNSPANTITLPSGSHVSMCNSLYYPHPKDRTSLVMTSNFSSKSNPLTKYDHQQHQYHSTSHHEHFVNNSYHHHHHHQNIQPELHSTDEIHEMNI